MKLCTENSLIDLTIELAGSDSAVWVLLCKQIKSKLPLLENKFSVKQAFYFKRGSDIILAGCLLNNVQENLARNGAI